MPEEVTIRFSPEQVATGSFRMLEPPDLCKLIESSADGLRCAFIWFSSILLGDALKLRSLGVS